MPAGTNFNEQHDIEFRQIVLLFTTALWLGLEWLYLDSTKHIQFSIIRAIYYFFVGIVRAEGAVQKDNTDFDIEKLETEPFISREMWKTMKIWFNDFLSWCFVIWAFGRSIM